MSLVAYSNASLAIATAATAAVVAVGGALYVAAIGRFLRWGGKKVRESVPPRPSESGLDNAIAWFFYPIDVFEAAGGRAVALLFTTYLLVFAVPIAVSVSVFAFVLKATS
jgi:hypothetical protein